jgi:hypothetical protein
MNYSGLEWTLLAFIIHANWIYLNEKIY